MDFGGLDDYTLGTGAREFKIQTEVSDAFGDSFREGLIQAYFRLAPYRGTEPMTLVDLATGPGLSLRIGMDILRPDDIRGTDTALFDWLEAAREIVGNTARLTDDDVQNLQIEDSSVHALNGRLILGHLKTHREVLTHWVDKLADNGVLTLTEFAGVALPPPEIWPDGLQDVYDAVVAYYGSYEQAWEADGKDLFAGFELAHKVARGELPDDRLVHGEANLTPIPRTLKELADVSEDRLKRIVNTWRKAGKNGVVDADARADAIQAIITPEILHKMRTIAPDWDGVRWIAATVVLQKGSRKENRDHSRQNNATHQR
jgi:hypothetical protein